MTDLDPTDVITEALKIINSIPDATEVCECEHTFDEHTRLGKRNIWICIGNGHRCLCIQFNKRTS